MTVRQETKHLPLDAFRPGAVVRACCLNNVTIGRVKALARNGPRSWVVIFDQVQVVDAEGHVSEWQPVSEGTRSEVDSPHFLCAALSTQHVTNLLIPSRRPLVHEERSRREKTWFDLQQDQARHGKWLRFGGYRDLRTYVLEQLLPKLEAGLNFEEMFDLERVLVGLHEAGIARYEHHISSLNTKRAKKWLKQNRGRMLVGLRAAEKKEDEMYMRMYEEDMEHEVHGLSRRQDDASDMDDVSDDGSCFVPDEGYERPVEWYMDDDGRGIAPVADLDAPCWNPSTGSAVQATTEQGAHHEPQDQG